MMGLLVSRSIYVTREQLRSSISRVDAAGRESRKRKAIQRRVYWVPGPHALHHIDGNHKLGNFITSSHHFY